MNRKFKKSAGGGEPKLASYKSVLISVIRTEFGINMVLLLAIFKSSTDFNFKNENDPKLEIFCYLLKRFMGFYSFI